MSRFLADVMRTSSIPLLLQFYLGLCQTNVSRRDVGVAIELAGARDLDRAPRASGGDVAALNEIGDANDVRLVIDRRREMRRDDLRFGFGTPEVVLALAPP